MSRGGKGREIEEEERGGGGEREGRREEEGRGVKEGGITMHTYTVAGTYTCTVYVHVLYMYSVCTL